METRSLLRTVIAALVGVGIVVLLIVLMFKIFTGHSGPAQPTINLGTYSDSAAEVTLLIDAPTNIDQDHRQVKIVVSATQNQYELIQGYQGNVIATQTYSNNTAAFAVFLQSLKLLDFTKGDANSTADYRGYCPTGERYVYTFNDGQKDLFTYWTTSCGQGIYHGNRAGTRLLFERQIPSHDLETLTRGAVPLG